MPNILDYLDWRGDLSFRAAPFNEVDNLILAELSFVDFSELVPHGADIAEAPTLQTAAERYFREFSERSEALGILVPREKIVSLLQKAAASRRFAGLRLPDFVNAVDTEREMQFSALTAETEEGRLFIAFRGTDDTLVGWKEDLNMGHLMPVPAQTEALRYLTETAERYPRHRISVGGHSKGGNLSVYAAVSAKKSVRDRIDAVYNNDGPGFGTALIETAEHREMEGRIHTIVPESDLVGMMLGHEERYTVVKSSGSPLFQHNGFTWQVLGDRFVYADDISTEGRIAEGAMRGFAEGLTAEQREKFSEVLYELLRASDAKTLSELEKDGFRTVTAMLRAHKELDEESRELLRNAFRLLLRENLRACGEQLPKVELPKRKRKSKEK